MADLGTQKIGERELSMTDGAATSELSHSSHHNVKGFNLAVFVSGIADRNQVIYVVDPKQPPRPISEECLPHTHPS